MKSLSESTVRTKQANVSRQELYTLVWSEPLETLIKRCNCSVYRLRKICIDLSIPVPGAGYWEKLKTGQAKKILPLPPLPAGKKQQVELTVSAVETASGISAASARRQILDPLLVAVQNTLNDKDTYMRDGLRCSQADQVEIRSSPGNIQRAIQFMNCFLQAFRAKGYSIKLMNGETLAIVNGQEMTIRCREKLHRISVNDHPFRSARLQPSGVLCFHIKCAFKETLWTEGKLTLEAQIPAILDKMEQEAVRRHQRELEKAAWRAEQEETNRLKKERDEKQLSELLAFKDLLQQATRWRQVDMIRDYLASIEQEALTTGTLTPERQAWLAWARAKADWYDPKIESKDEWLIDVDKATLTIKKYWH